MERFAVTVEVVLRMCQQADLPALEWLGAFREHRRLIEDAYRQQCRGEGLMLLAEVQGFAAGQVWVDLADKRGESVGVVWAFRVFPCLSRRGIGTRLLARAEQLLAQCGFELAEVAVDDDNLDALGFYHRRGYRTLHHELQRYSYARPDGSAARVEAPRWILRKALDRAPLGDGNVTPRGA